MKKTLFLLLLSVSFMLKSQDNYEITTLRIGPMNLKMNVDDADKIAGKKLTADNDFYSSNEINYNGEKIYVYVFNGNADKQLKRIIGHIYTKSPKFKTKRGMGVGSTRNELIEA